MTSLFQSCGPDCARQKHLDELKAVMDRATPETAAKARTDYYTALNGQGWLAKEKEKIAKSDIEPVLRQYRDQYDAIDGSLKSQSQVSSLARAIKSDGGLPLLLQDYNAEKTKADVLNRSSYLSSGVVGDSSSNWVNSLLTGVIALCILAILVLIYFKFVRPKSTPTLPDMLPASISGGKSSR